MTLRQRGRSCVGLGSVVEIKLIVYNTSLILLFSCFHLSSLEISKHVCLLLFSYACLYSLFLLFFYLFSALEAIFFPLTSKKGNSANADTREPSSRSPTRYS